MRFLYSTVSSPSVLTLHHYYYYYYYVLYYYFLYLQPFPSLILPTHFPDYYVLYYYYLSSSTIHLHLPLFALLQHFLTHVHAPLLIQFFTHTTTSLSLVLPYVHFPLAKA